MSEITNTNVSNNNVSEAGVYKEGPSPGRCPGVQTSGSGYHQASLKKLVDTR